MLLLSIACYSVLLFSGVAVRSRSQPTQAQSLTPADTTFDKQLTSRRYSAHGESRRIETRALQQVAAAEYVTTVSTAEELVEAVARGDAHIELQAHVDLTALEESSSAFLLGDAVPGSVQSITGSCSDGSAPPFALPATSPALLQLLPNQCVVLVATGFMHVQDSQLWLHNIYVRLRRTESETGTAATGATAFGQLITVDATAEFWMTSSRLQGDGDGVWDCVQCGLNVLDGAAVYVQDSSFLDFDGTRVVWVGPGSSLSARQCSFIGTTLSAPPQDAPAAITSSPLDSALLVADATGQPADLQPAALQLQEVTFSRNTPLNSPKILAPSADTATLNIFSDSAAQDVCVRSPVDSTAVGECMYSGARSLSEVEEGFLSDDNSWILKNVGVLPRQAGAADAPAASQPPILAIVAGVAGAVGFLAAAAVVFFYVWPQRSKQAQQAKDEEENMVLSPFLEDSVSGQQDNQQNHNLAPPPPAAASTSTRHTNPDRSTHSSSSRSREQQRQSGPELADRPVSSGSKRRSNAIRNAPEIQIQNAPLDRATRQPSTAALGQGQDREISPMPWSDLVRSAALSASGQRTATERSSDSNYNLNLDSDGQYHSRSASRSRSHSHTHGSSTQGHNTTSRSLAGGSAAHCQDELPGVSTQDDSLRTESEMVPTERPGPAATTQQRKEFLGQQLDTLAGRTVLGTLVVLGGFQHRFSGGQAIVQIAEEPRTRLDFAMKFFLSKAAFEQEKGLYLDDSQPLGKFLPGLKNILEDGQLTDAHGNAFPSCIVMEKGESLDVCIEQSGDLDRIGCLQVFYQVAQRLQDLHTAGYVHRDIKPANVMWLPQKKRWTLIDFGCAVPAGSQTQFAFTLYYCAPEVMGPYLERATSHHASEAVDAWALGLMALELFSGKRLFGRETPYSTEQVQRMIMGDEKAPWESPDTAPALLKSLGRVQSVVLGLLNRDPDCRTTMEHCMAACRRILQVSTITVNKKMSKSDGDAFSGGVVRHKWVADEVNTMTGSALALVS